MKDFVIFDYEDKYEVVVNEMEKQQWGVWFEGGIVEKVKQGSIVKLAKCGDEIAGVSYYRVIGDLLYYQAIVVKPKFQHENLGSMFMNEAIDFAKKKELKNVFCEAIIAGEKMNAEHLLNKFGFKEILRVKDYWGSLYPEVLCKECGCKPCKCGCAFFVKNF